MSNLKPRSETIPEQGWWDKEDVGKTVYGTTTFDTTLPQPWLNDASNQLFADGVTYDEIRIGFVWLYDTASVFGRPAPLHLEANGWLEKINEKMGTNWPIEDVDLDLDGLLENPNRCPYPDCRSENIDSKSLDTDGDYHTRSVSCDECGREWEELYVFTAVRRDGTDCWHEKQKKVEL